MLLGTIAAIIFASSLGEHVLPRRLQSSDAAYAVIVFDGIASRKWPFVVFEATVMAAAVVAIIGVRRRLPIVAGGGLAFVALAGSLLWTGVVRPAQVRTRSLVDFAPAVRARVASAPVYVAYFDPEFAWYYERSVPPLPSTIARLGAPSRDPIYLVARPRELVRLAPEVRTRLKLAMHAQVYSGGGPPALYEIPQISALADLKGAPQATK
jgi:hypothetical protein